MLPKCLILLALPEAELLQIRWPEKSHLNLLGGFFSSTLIILEGQGIDVILGMNWMKMHRVVLDISTHLVHLDSPMYGKVSL
jgi:hypothetical protein